MKQWILMVLLVLTACWPGISSSTELPEITNPPSPTGFPAPYPSTAPSVAPSDTLSAISLPSPTVSSFEEFTIERLRERPYGGGEIEIMGILEEREDLTRYLIRYPSDGLMIYGFAVVPSGAGPHPVVIAIHGLADSNTYANPGYDTDAFDRIAQNGYIVIHPFLRNYAPSENGDNLYRVGMSIDVLNLMALIRSDGKPVDLFSQAAGDRIGLWGYSLGGDIVLRVLTISTEVDAAVLYSSLSGDENRNAELLWQLSFDPVYQNELLTPPAEFDKISPSNFYRYITASIQLYHGTADPIVPVAWALETCAGLKEAGVDTNCIYFPNEGHSFRRRVSDQFYATMFDFLGKHLSP